MLAFHHPLQLTRSLFFYKNIDSIIPTVVLPTTEIIEPIFQKICEKLLKLFQQLCKMVITNSDYSENLF